MSYRITKGLLFVYTHSFKKEMAAQMITFIGNCPEIYEIIKSYTD